MQQHADDCGTGCLSVSEMQNQLVWHDSSQCFSKTAADTAPHLRVKVLLGSECADIELFSFTHLRRKPFELPVTRFRPASLTTTQIADVCRSHLSACASSTQPMLVAEQH